MAKENATINLYVNNDQAKAAVAELSKTYIDLKKAREAAQKAGNVKEAMELEAQELTAKKNLHESNCKIFITEIVLGNLSTINTNQLITVKRKLRKELNLINRDTDEYKDKLVVLKKVEAELAKTQGRRVGIMSKLTPVVSVDRVASKLVGEVSQAVDAYARYDDKLADVMKTTGLAKSETVALSESLAKIDTRSSQIELLNLASQAGKLGLSAAADVEKFTIAADKIGVALGEDLGDKEAAINSMGKLSDLFKLKDEYGMGDAMLKVGSAVNALGAASTANEGYIVDFTSRTGGIAVSAGVAASSVMALGATFDSLNQPAEASATVVNKLIVGMFSKTSEYAKVAKMEVKAFADLLKTDANEALLRVLEGMDGADLGATAQMLGEVGENGAKAAAAVATISKNIGFVREQQELARVEFEKGTSVVAEAEIKNNTAQARREKQQKAAQAALVELGEKLQPIVDMFYAGSIRGMKALKELIGVIYEYKGIIAAVSAALGIYLVAQKLHTNWSRLQAYWSGITSKAILAETSSLAAASLGTKALAAAKMLLTGQFRAATLAAKSFFVSHGPGG
ncbi:MAG: phage tail tape measure protein, partial [Mucinivorans sp.]